MQRTNCIICKHPVNDFIQFEMPVFMGTSDNIVKQTEHMAFQECVNCGNVQIKTQVDPTILYQNNHNIGVYGKMWEEHYQQLASFVAPVVENKNVFEISDPSLKILKKSTGYKTWTIIEPNIDIQDIPANVFIIRDFFSKDYKTDKKYDVIIHSHFMEHVFDIHEFLDKCYDLLNEDGVMAFSIPNLHEWLKRANTPVNVLHFEHTYFYTHELVSVLLTNHGFTVDSTEYYKNHSIFYKCRKTVPISQPYSKIQVANLFLNCHTKCLEHIEKINSICNDRPETYIFSGHVFSQYYIFNGLAKITGILDNSVNKQGKYLFGTDYKIESPNRIVNDSAPIVICSHTGVYFDEIAKQLRDLNKNVVIL